MDGQRVRRSDLAPSNTASRSRRGCVSGRRRGSFRAETVQVKPLKLHACALWIRSRFRNGHLSYVWSTVSLASCQGSRCLGSVRRRRCAISSGPSRGTRSALAPGREHPVTPRDNGPPLRRRTSPRVLSWPVPVGFLWMRRNHHITVPMEDRMATTHTTTSNLTVKIVAERQGQPARKARGCRTPLQRRRARWSEADWLRDLGTPHWRRPQRDVPRAAVRDQRRAAKLRAAPADRRHDGAERRPRRDPRGVRRVRGDRGVQRLTMAAGDGALRRSVVFFHRFTESIASPVAFTRTRTSRNARDFPIPTTHRLAPFAAAAPTPHESRLLLSRSMPPAKKRADRLLPCRSRFRMCRSFSCRRRDGSAIGTPSCYARSHRSAHRPLRVAPAQIAGTPGERRRGVRRADGRAVCPPDGLSGSSGREGTTDNPSTGGHHDRRRTQEDHDRRPRHACGASR